MNLRQLLIKHIYHHALKKFPQELQVKSPLCLPHQLAVLTIQQLHQLATLTNQLRKGK